MKVGHVTNIMAKYSGYGVCFPFEPTVHAAIHRSKPPTGAPRFPLEPFPLQRETHFNLRRQKALLALKLPLLGAKLPFGPRPAKGRFRPRPAASTEPPAPPAPNTPITRRPRRLDGLLDLGEGVQLPEAQRDQALRLQLAALLHQIGPGRLRQQGAGWSWVQGHGEEKYKTNNLLPIGYCPGFMSGVRAFDSKPCCISFFLTSYIQQIPQQTAAWSIPGLCPVAAAALLQGFGHPTACQKPCLNT